MIHNAKFVLSCVAGGLICVSFFAGTLPLIQVAVLLLAVANLIA